MAIKKKRMHPCFQKIFFILILNGAVLTKLSSRHIIGGDVTYRCVRSDSSLQRTTFKIDFNIFRDSKGGGAPFDQNPAIGIYRLVNGSWIFTQVLNVNLSINEPVPINNANPCVIAPPNIGVDRGFYGFEVTLPWGFEYMIVYQRCCRNNTINNIRDPGDQGAAFNVRISKFAVENCKNSPTFVNSPPPVVCNNKPLRFDHSARDVDGDSLVYIFCAPSTAGGTFGIRQGENAGACNGVSPDPSRCPPPYNVVNFISPYSVEQPMLGNPIVSIDQKTGLISGKPTTEGQFVIGVCVQEYRKGELIGEIQRDFQFNVSDCENVIEAIATAKDNSIKNALVKNNIKPDTTYVRSCGATAVLFQNKSIIKTDLKDITYQWEFSPNGEKIKINKADAVFFFPRLGSYQGLFIVNPDKPDCTDSTLVNIDIFNTLEADFTQSYDTCTYGPVIFSNKSIFGQGLLDSVIWYFDNEGKSNQYNPQYQFRSAGDKNITLILKDKNLCFDTLTKTMSYLPAPTEIEIAPTKFVACEPGEIDFINNTKPINEKYNIVWSFGDGAQQKAINPKHTYSKPGVYDIKVQITSPIGCYTERLYPKLIEVKESPIAKFDYTPKELSFFQRDVSFTDQSQKADVVAWRFGNLGSSLVRNPKFTFPDTGQYEIIQTVTKNNGCQSISKAVLDILPVATIQIPNAFTPNNDGLNDEFRVKGFFQGIKDYKIRIFNRYGEQLFEADNPLSGWTGLSKDGNEAPSDVYVYLIEYITARNEPKSYKGNFTLIK
jgi:gliding motility-associated-like protein